MAAQPQQEEEIDGTQIEDHNHDLKLLLSCYLGLSFTLFLGLLPQNSIPLLSSLQTKNKALSFRVIETEEQVEQLRKRSKEDSKANARVAEIFASHRQGWQQVEKRLLQQIDDSNEEISFLKSRVEEFQRLENKLKDLRREVSERDETIRFIDGNSNGNGYGELGLGHSGDVGFRELGEEQCFDVLNSAAASKLRYTKPNSWQDLQFQSHESIYHLKNFVARWDTPWQGNRISEEVSSKLKLLNHDLLNTYSADVQLQMHKQAKRYQALAGKMDNLCDRMKASDPEEAKEYQALRQTELLLEAFRLQKRALEIDNKLTEVKQGRGKPLESAGNSFKEIQRSLEIWLARIIGDLEGSLAKDNSAARGRDQFYLSRFP